MEKQSPIHQMMKRWFACALVLVIFPSVSAGAVVASKAKPQLNQTAPFLPAWEPSARYGHSMVILNGKAYLFGGATAFISDTVQIASLAAVNGHAPASMLLNDTSIFDPDLTVWTPEDPANSPPPPRYKHSAVSLGEKMYILFGEGAQGGLLQDIWMYDPLSKEWQEQVVSSVSKPAARSGHTSVVLAGQIFVYGGKTGTGAVNDLWSFNLQSREWMQRGNGPNAVYGHTAVANPGGKMYVFGGYNTDYQLDLLSYDLNTNTWANIAVQGNRPAPRAFHVAWLEAPNIMTINGGRGYNSSGVVTELGDTWECDIAETQCAKKAYTNPRAFSAAVSDTAAFREPSNLRELESRELAPQAAFGTVILFFGGLRNGQTIAETFEYTGQYLFYLPLIVR